MVGSKVIWPERGHSQRALSWQAYGWVLAIYRRDKRLAPPLGRLSPPLTDDRWTVLPS